MWLLLCYRGPTHRGGKSPYDWLLVKIWLNINVHTEAHLFSVPNDCLWYDKLWGPSQRVVTLLFVLFFNVVLFHCALIQWKCASDYILSLTFVLNEPVLLMLCASRPCQCADDGKCLGAIWNKSIKPAPSNTQQNTNVITNTQCLWRF